MVKGGGGGGAEGKIGKKAGFNTICCEWNFVMKSIIN